jgi:hypothetical protein
VAAVVAALFVATERNDGDWSSFAASTTVIGPSAYMGPEGGRMEIPVTDANGPGISIDLPGDALSINVGMAMSAAPPRFADVAALATREPGVWSGLADYALDNDDTLLDPAFGALELASLIESLGPAVRRAETSAGIRRQPVRCEQIPR